METYALIFLITVGILYVVSLSIVGVKGNNEFMAGHSISDSHPLVRVENRDYIPCLLACLAVAGWFMFIKNPSEPISALIPNTVTSGWLWTIGTASLVFMPFVLNYDSIFLFIRVKPQSKLMSVVVNVMLIVSLVLQAVMLYHVYGLWFFLLPMVLATILVMVIRHIFPMIFFTPQRNNSSSSSSMPVRRSSSSRRTPSMPTSYPETRERSSDESCSSRSELDRERMAREEERRKREQEQERREREAARYYDLYQDSKNRLDRLLGEIDTCIRSAEDNEYWAREFNDSFKASAARSDRERAERLSYESRKVQDDVERYYRLYEEHRR